MTQQHPHIKISRKFQENCKKNHICESLKTLKKFANAFTYKGLFNSLELFVKIYKNICAYRKIQDICKNICIHKPSRCHLQTCHNHYHGQKQKPAR